jgi:hypothetical protein
MATFLSLWYSLEVSSEDTKETLFNGVFSVNDINGITGIYETIDGQTDFTNNLLIVNLGTNRGYTYKDYPIYDDAEYNVFSDTTYEKNWLQFDRWGVLISSASNFPGAPLVKFRAPNLGDETISNKGTCLVYQADKNYQELQTLYNIKQIIIPPNINYWYNIGITLNDEAKTPVFQGLISTNFTYDLTGFYETIDGNTDFTNNLLKTNGGRACEISYDGFECRLFPRNTLGNVYYVDNAYKPNWLQFDNPGALITKTSYFPDATIINLCCNNVGDETITNEGIILKANQDGTQTSLNALFTINPTSPPV